MRRATIRTRGDDADATMLARALGPDNTAEMQTTVTEDGTLETRIERETTGGLHATVDDYVVNLEVATEVAAVATAVTAVADGGDDSLTVADDTASDPDAPTTDGSDSTRDGQPERPADAGSASDHDTTSDNE